MMYVRAGHRPAGRLGCFGLISSVARSRFGGSRTKKQGRGEGKGEEETKSGKIRLRGPRARIWPTRQVRMP